MNKLELLKKIHELIWKDDDLMEQEILFELQTLIDSEIIEESQRGNLDICQLSNGYIKRIDIL